MRTVFGIRMVRYSRIELFYMSVVVSFGCSKTHSDNYSTGGIPSVAIDFCSDKGHKLDQALSLLNQNDDESRGAVESSTLGLQSS